MNIRQSCCLGSLPLVGALEATHVDPWADFPREVGGIQLQREPAPDPKQGIKWLKGEQSLNTKAFHSASFPGSSPTVGNGGRLVSNCLTGAESITIMGH